MIDTSKLPAAVLVSASLMGLSSGAPAAENRSVYSANHGTSLPGTLRKSEGQATNSDADVESAYVNTGAFYDASTTSGAATRTTTGAQVTSTVHYSTTTATRSGTGRRWCTATAMASTARRSRDVVTAHELTHAVTENESGLIYSGESGGMNESMSDIFGAFVERGWTAASRHAGHVGGHLDWRGHHGAGPALYGRPRRRRRIATTTPAAPATRRALQLGRPQPGLLPAVAGRHAPARQDRPACGHRHREGDAHLLQGQRGPVDRQLQLPRAARCGR